MIKKVEGNLDATWLAKEIIGKCHLTISSRWDSPIVLHRVTIDGIEIKLDIKDFAEALKQEIDIPGFVNEILVPAIGSIKWTFKQETFEQQVTDAIEKTKKEFDDRCRYALERVLRGVKEESVKVVTKPIFRNRT
jgi:hypothetical protein